MCRMLFGPKSVLNIQKTFVSCGSIVRSLSGDNRVLTCKDKNSAKLVCNPIRDSFNHRSIFYPSVLFRSLASCSAHRAYSEFPVLREILESIIRAR